MKSKEISPQTVGGRKGISTPNGGGLVRGRGLPKMPFSKKSGLGINRINWLTARLGG